ncbi:MAG: cell division protein FtsQ/DivIB [Pseudolabrys sp.]|jgi:cell division protein FtsQ
MDDRGHLAQAPIRKIGRRAAVVRWLRAHTSAQPGWRRTFLRWSTTLLQLEMPRGAGASAAALLLVASAGYGAVRGDHLKTIVANVQDICDSAANTVGFGISEIAIAGRHNLTRKAILAAAGITGQTSLLFLNAHAARARLMKNPWVAEATVLKLYPSRLRIGITERKPFALWQKDRHVSLIAADGTVLEPYAPRRFLSLPLVVGKGAQHDAQDFLALVRRYPDIAPRVKAYALVADRRWNLYLKDGVEVLLPDADPAHALDTLVDLDRDKKLLSRDITRVDLRLADRVTVRLSDAAYATREAAIKAAEKARKAKRKGGEA